MQNIEYKAELRNIGLARSICIALGGEAMGVLEQTDSYFHIAQGRLKKRETLGEETQYLFYERPNRAAPRACNYTIYTEQEALTRFGALPLPVWVVVRKRRELFLLDHTRVHLDDVPGLGTFLEFESPVTPARPAAVGHSTVARLKAAFGPALGEAVSVSYCDLVKTAGE
jgi:adenylate cyclase class IV